MPKISVLIPCYNAARYVRAAVDSILGQSCRDFELVMVDDGSTDTTLEILRTYTDPRLKLTVLPENCGVAAARNVAMQQAVGDYLAFLDADDVSRSDRLRIQADFLDSHADIDLVGSAYRSLGKLKIWKTPLNHSRIVGEALFKLPFRMSTVMFRRHVLREDRVALNTAFQVSEDHDFIDQLIASGSLMANLPEALVEYRSHANNTSNRFASMGIGYADVVRKRAVVRLLPGSTEEELALHEAIASRSPALRPEDAPQVADWLEKLYHAPGVRQLPEPEEFLKALARQWDQVCALFAGRSLGRAIRAFYSRPLLSRASGFSGQAAFLARCCKKRGKNRRQAPGRA